MPDDLEARTSQGSDGSAPQLGMRQRRLSRRLLALIAIPAAAVVVLGAQRTSQADSSAAANRQVQQLASLGGAITGEHGLTSDAEDEADSAAVYIALGRTGSASQLMLPQAHFDITNLQENEVTQLASEIDTRSSPAVPGALTSAEAAIGKLKHARQEATSVNSQASALSVVQGYYASIGPLFALDDQIASTSGDPTLSADVRSLDALSRAEDAASEERAILDAVLTRGYWQPGELTQLSGSSAEYAAELSEFTSGLSSAQSSAYSSQVSGRDVDIAGSMLQQALTIGQTGALPANPVPSTFPSTERAWYESMTFKLDQMRVFEQSLVDAIQSRSNALQTQTTQAVVGTWLEVLAVLVALLAVAVIAARRSSPAAVHWI
jgi:hypothetical protein